MTKPEAAALSAILDRYHSVKAGNVFIVCDAGARTVVSALLFICYIANHANLGLKQNLVTYEIESVDPIHMREAVEGQGEYCEGICVDEAFERICRERLDRTWKALSRGGKNGVMKDIWEYSNKPRFNTGKPDKEYIVRLPKEMFSNKPKQRLDNTTKEPVIKRAFTKVFTDIVDLIDAQIDKASALKLDVTEIILTGGLGGSPYLHSHLKDIYSSKAISVLQPSGMKPRTAICQGAACKTFAEADGTGAGPEGHKPIAVTSTICRASYGVRFCDYFDEKKHLAKDKYWNEDGGMWMAANQMQWYLERVRDPMTRGFWSFADL
ncbi:hypothetical protein LCI18_008054 [Fusarium solani-melongenae]|uniref:Uncharacterized protein n=1 Tax=Fusarium solani subsp. cucurbitae TaxID=2747967 RepID=A0ACD3Z767_FUSSC|nr:hypothetical protein LCI18_008054 [Fusarium solani-melongenae]